MSTTSNQLATVIVEFFWSRLPAEAARLSRTLAVILRDGDVLVNWPIVAAAAPLAALVLGLLIGITHPGDTYTYSAPLLAILAAIAGLGAAPGFWALIGFAAGDFFLHRRDAFFFGRTLGDSLPAYIALLISYAVLAGLLVLAPVVAVALRLRAERALVRVVPQVRAVALVFQVVLQSAYAYLWAQSAAFLIRPIWSFRDRSPTTADISPLQTEAWLLVLATALGAGARVYLTLRAPAVRPARPRAGRRLAPLARVPAQVTILLKALFLSALVSGLMSGPIEAAIVYVLIAGAIGLREIVMPRAEGVVRPIRRIPLLFRLILAGAVAYFLATILVEPVARSTSSFDSLLATIVLSLFASAVLLPAASSRIPG